MSFWSFLVAVSMSAAAFSQTLEYRNSVSLGNSISEMSGITWTGGTSWSAVADKQNVLAKLSVQINPATGAITSASIDSTDTIGGSGGDYEGIAYDPNRQSYFVSSEATSSVHEFAQNNLGTVYQYLKPTSFNQTRGNLSLESLSINAAGTRLYTANEEALSIDGTRATVTDPTKVRVVEYSITGNTVGSGLTELRQFVYQVDPISIADANGTTHVGQSGLSDMVVLPDGKLLMLERAVSYTRFALLNQDIPHFRTRIYLVDPLSATALADSTVAITAPANTGSSTPVAKQLLLEKLGTPLFGTEPFVNLEGLGIGPATDHGITILGINDNQTNASLKTIVHAFEYTPKVPEPSSALLGLMSAGFLTLRRR